VLRILNNKIDIVNLRFENIKKTIKDYDFTNEKLENAYYKFLKDLEAKKDEIQNYYNNEYQIESRSSLLRKIIQFKKASTKFDENWFLIQLVEKQRRNHPFYRIIDKLFESPFDESIIIPIFGSGFQIKSIREVGGITINLLFIPPSLEKNPLTYPIFYHEMGHIYLENLREHRIFREVQETISVIGEKINFEIHRSHGGQQKKIRKEWDELSRHWQIWRKELFCDGIGLYLSGPAYIFNMIYYKYPDNPFEVYNDHPPLELRMKSLFQLSEKLEIPISIIDKAKNKWSLFKNNLKYDPSPKYNLLEDENYQNQKILNSINECIINSIDDLDKIQFDTKTVKLGLKKLKNGRKIDYDKIDDPIDIINIGWIEILYSNNQYADIIRKINNNLI